MRPCLPATNHSIARCAVTCHITSRAVVSLISCLQIIDGHFSGFDADVAKMSNKLVDATIELHRQVMNNFLPSAVKFHYQFNLREMSNITQGLCRTFKEYYKQPITVRGCN